LAIDVATNKEYAIKICEKKLIKKENKQKAVMREKEIMNILDSNQSRQKTKHLNAVNRDKKIIIKYQQTWLFVITVNILQQSCIQITITSLLNKELFNFRLFCV